MKRSLLTLSLLALAPAGPLRAGPELEPLREIAIQDGGRTKPFDSFARELARRVQGARAFGFDTRGRPRAHRVGAGDARRARALEGGADRQGDPRGAARGGRAAARARTATASRSWPTTRASRRRWRGSARSSGDREEPRPRRARGARPLRHALDLPGRHVGRVAPHRAPPRRPEGRLVLDRRPRDPQTAAVPRCSASARW